LKSDYTSFRILLVDNGSTKENVENIKNEMPKDDRIILRRISPNKGYVEGINYGLRCSMELNPDYLLIMNNDTVVDERLISSLISCAKRYDNKCIVSGKVLDYDNKDLIQTTGSLLINKKLLLYKHIGQSVIDNGQFENEAERDLLDDIFWLFNVKLYKETGGYNSIFYFNGESADFAIRAIKKGYKLIYCPSAKLWHKGSVSVGGRKNNPYLSYWNIRSKLIVRYLHLSKSNFLLFYFLVIKNIIIKYLKSIKNLFYFRLPCVTVPNAELKGLIDFTFTSIKQIKAAVDGKNGQNDHLIPEQKDHPLTGAN
jgi:hypothetical protein